MQDGSFRRGRIRAMRRENARAQLERRLMWLGLGPDWRTMENETELAQRLARALRRERRAAGHIRGGYDPLRHLVLARLAKMVSRRRRPDFNETICAAPSAAPGPSCGRARNASRHSSARPSGSRRRAPTWRDIAQATFRTGSSDDGGAT
jgi:hypothetical protein